MTKKEAIEILKQYNAWRRQNDDKPRLEMPNPTLIGVAIDFVIKELEK